jgi:tetratricopeptide (TPR) repeat protein
MDRRGGMADSAARGRTNMKNFLLAVVYLLAVVLLAFVGWHLLQPYIFAPSPPDPVVVGETKTIAAKDTTPDDRIDAYFRRAVAYAHNNQTDKAVADYRAILTLAPDRSDTAVSARRLLIRTYTDAGDYAHAMAEWKIYATDPARTYSALLIRASIYRAMGDDAREGADLDAAVKMDPMVPEAYYARSDYLERHRRYDDALRDLATVDKMTPDQPQTRIARAGILMREWDFGGAWREFNSVYTKVMAEARTGVLAGRAQDEMRKLQFKPAIADYTTLIARDPQDFNYRIDRGDLYLWSGQPDKGFADLKQAVSDHPVEPWPHLALAEAYAGQFRFAESLPEYKLAILFSENRGWLRHIRGYTELEMDRTDDAAADFAAAHAIDPQDVYTVIGLHMVSRRTHRDDKAEFAANVAAVKSHDWPAPLLDYFSGRTDRAGFAAAARTASGNEALADRMCEVNFYAGEDALERSDRAAAIPALQSAAKTCYPGYIEFDMAR